MGESYLAEVGEARCLGDGRNIPGTCRLLGEIPEARDVALHHPSDYSLTMHLVRRLQFRVAWHHFGPLPPLRTSARSRQARLATVLGLRRVRIRPAM